MCPSPNGRPTFGTLRLEVDRADGSQETYTQDIHSYLDNWYGAMQLIMHNDTRVTLTNTAGTAKTFETGNGSGPWDPNSMRMQLLIGSDGSSFRQDDSSLGGTITNSDVESSGREDANRLVRQSTSFSISSDNTIRETGIRWQQLQDRSGSQHAIHWERTVLETPVSVSDGDTISVTYEHTWGAP